MAHGKSSIAGPERSLIELANSMSGPDGAKTLDRIRRVLRTWFVQLAASRHRRGLQASSRLANALQGRIVRPIASARNANVGDGGSGLRDALPVGLWPIRSRARRPRARARLLLRVSHPNSRSRADRARMPSTARLPPIQEQSDIQSFPCSHGSPASTGHVGLSREINFPE